MDKTQKYNCGSAIKVISGENEGKRGYIEKYDALDNTYMIVDGVVETEKFRVEEAEIEVINSNYFVFGFKEEGESVIKLLEGVDDEDIQKGLIKLGEKELANFKLEDYEGKKINYVPYSEKLCFNCLKEYDDIKVYNLCCRGYGSIYDGTDTKLQLCSCCREMVDEGLNKLFNEIPTYVDYWEEYKYEEILSKFITLLPLQGQELFDNQVASGWTAHKIDSQDWLDIQTGIAPDSVYKKNHMYSPSEAKAYKERFPVCKHVYLKVYGDGSSHCKCDFGASGNKDGSCGKNISSNCYYCDIFELRDKPMKVDEVKKVELKEVAMVEYFCPTCGVKTLMYKDEVAYGNMEGDFCKKCYQDIAFSNVDSFYDQNSEDYEDEYIEEAEI